MQLSAANLLIAAQQVARQAPQAQATQAKEKPADGVFAPLDFKQTAAPARQEPAPAPSRPGATLDIRV
jgi:hypothetical protein